MKKILAFAVLMLIPLAAANAGFRFGPEIGIYHGTGVVVQAGFGNTGIEFAAGYYPMILFVTNQSDIRWLSTFDFSGGVFQTFGPAERKFRPGGLFSVHYNTVLGAGLGGAFKGILRAGKMEINANVGAKFYFDGRKKVMDRENLIEVEVLGTSLVIGIGVGLLF